ncbi:RNA-guided endonuclease InsQ/TnpB family protein [Clostridium sp. WILCCON 0269]|uniref:RNA-guided endonuclease InsQ/TnpB family protein n=1 Tax=Candidatus Clostridium eludens TaxID=3381663 RepID=A0ABW8SE46_9CLOT
MHRTIGVSRFIYNFYLAHNREVYGKEKEFVSGMDFSKWLNNAFIPNNPDKAWIKEVSSKSTKQAIMNGEKAFKKFFKGESGFPRFKKKKNQDVKAYFPKNNKSDWTIERHRVKIPTLKWVRLKEKGYIPVNATVKSGTVSYKAGRYYVSVLVELPEYNDYSDTINQGIGIDLGLKGLAICSNGKTYKNMNKTKRVKKLEKSLKRQQRKLSRKYESLKKNKRKGGTATRQNIQKQIVKVQKLHQKLSNIRQDYTRKVISEIVKQKPSYITIEDLAVSNMMKNKHLSKAVAQQNLSGFRKILTYKCNWLNIELRIVDRFYPSSKTCHNCGHINKNLKLSDRVYICPKCGYIGDRDYNASLNLKDCEIYKIA